MIAIEAQNFKLRLRDETRGDWLSFHLEFHAFTFVGQTLHSDADQNI